MAALTAPHWQAVTPQMKLDAVVGRGTRKDFYDLYFIVPHISLEELLARGPDKYPGSRDLRMRVLPALVDFDIANQQDEPAMLQPVDWPQVKAFFQAEGIRLGKKWFGQE